jgi:hypothetical protein
MKTKLLPIFALALAFTLCSCGHKSPNKIVLTETGTTANVVVEEDEESGLSHFSDTLTDNQYHQMILEAIANGDRQMFAKMVSHPLCRQYPLPDIENEGRWCAISTHYLIKTFVKSWQNLIPTHRS